MKPLQVLLAILVCAFLPLHAADLSDLTYITTGERVKKVTITDCKVLASGTLVIPSTIEGNPVTSIGDGAFDGCTNLTSITIPNSVTSIGDGAFVECVSLTSITIPDSVTSIGGETFIFCTSLTSITIPNGITSIGREAFGGCTSLTSVTFTGAAPTLSSDAFSGVANGAVALVFDSTLGPNLGIWNGLKVVTQVAGADFSGGDLSGANLSGANLSGADLSNLEAEETNFTGADLTGAQPPFSPIRSGPKAASKPFRQKQFPSSSSNSLGKSKKSSIKPMS